MACTLYLAPMAGVTDRVFRRLCFDWGCDCATTEMVSAQGLLSAPRDKGAYRYLLARDPGEGPVAAQLFGSDPEYLGRAAMELTAWNLFTAIDLNMGCPAQKIVGGQAGSALMKNPALAARIVEQVKKATFLPVTVKMRLGWDDQHRNAVAFAREMESAGADLLTVHGRTRAQQYAGKADWETIARVKEAVSIPVIANGDIVDGASAREALLLTHCDGLAVGRGALGRPWVFRKIRAALEEQPFVLPSYSEIVDIAMRHAREMAAWRGEKSALLEMRKHFSWYISGIRGAAGARVKLCHAESFQEAEAVLRSLIQEEGESP